MLEMTSRALNAHFARLARHKKPTGNPDCPQAVQRAKRLRRALLAKAGAQSVSKDAGLQLGIETEKGDAEDNEEDGEEESEVDEMLDVESGINDGEAEVKYSESSNGGGGGCVEGERRTADPPASADAVRVADDERLIEEPGLPALPVQAGRNVSRNSGRPSRKGTLQPKIVTTTTPVAPRQGGLTSTPALKNDATFTSNAARTRNRIGRAAKETTASAKQLGSVAVGMVTSQEKSWVAEMNERRLIREEAERREDRRRKEEVAAARERRERRAERREDRKESQRHVAMMMSMMTIIASAQGLSIPSGEMARRKRKKSKTTKDQREGEGESSAKEV
ncbi:hypothetical protein PsorP6_005949 [Peronosclerospora sorghi]|uniref:Uncharacterized protein n=1 Tax=Peronosclerospora sorghi TaxID=230839 RepID=A0ACC0W5R7_9STRA|nr:hypothetical protein PsorP6_005949 [Peronosclerospora sorghi]